MSLNDHWMQRDLDVLWHPCTQMKDHERLPLVAIRKASGVWLEDFDGKRYWTRSALVGQCLRPRQPAHQRAHSRSVG